MQPKHKNGIEKAILFVPLFLAFIWMGYVVIDNQNAEPGVKMAPSLLDGMVNALFIFIIGYAVVLTIMFIMMNKKMKVLVQAPEKKKAKAKPKKK